MVINSHQISLKTLLKHLASPRTLLQAQQPNQHHICILVAGLRDVPNVEEPVLSCPVLYIRISMNIESLSHFRATRLCQFHRSISAGVGCLDGQGAEDIEWTHRHLSHFRAMAPVSSLTQVTCQSARVGCLEGRGAED